MTSASALDIRPVTPHRWDDLARLFGARGACGGCWCMHWRLARPEFERGKGEGNKAALRKLVTSDRRPPGVIAYVGGEAVGWCAVAPRETYVRLERARVLRRIDAEPVWSIVCLFVATGHRRRGVSVALIEGAARFAASQGAAIVEGYPVESKGRDIPPVFAWTGTASAFLAAGFREAARGAPSRPIMRRQFARGTRPERSGAAERS
jgi:GNAT superfamily N-acetyltransferase